MTSTKFGSALFLVLAVLFPLVILGSNAIADGFTNKGVRFDGKVTTGKLDENNNLGFSGLARWNAPVVVRFSPIVRAQFSLAPFIETEAEGILGAHTVTLSFIPKTRAVSYENLRIKILDREGDEIPSSGMASQSGSGWVLGIATEKEPFDIHITYSSEKGSILTPAASGEKEDL